MSTHVDDFTLLRFAVGDATQGEWTATDGHLKACAQCTRALSQLRDVGAGLRQLAAEGHFEEVNEPGRLPGTDPFGYRPRPPRRPLGPREKVRIPPSAIHVGSAVTALLQQILESAAEGRAESLVDTLDLEDPGQRLALLFSLQEAGRKTGEDPLEGLHLAKVAIARLRRVPRRGVPGGLPERIVPWHLLWGQAHILGGQAYLWTKEFGRAGSLLRVAYRAFGKTGDETSMAIAELNEAQRRALAHQGATALILAGRARATFEDRELEDLAARAMVAEGLALFDLDRQEEAVAKYRLALPVFERHGLWGNWIGTLNSLGTSLNRLGQNDQARREYARALRRFSRKEHRSWLGFMREGLGDVLFGVGKYREAAIAFGRAAQGYAECGLRPNALIVMTSEIESWARAGNPARAAHRLELLRADIAGDNSLDAAASREIGRALAEVDPALPKLSAVRDQIQGSIGRRRPR